MYVIAGLGNPGREYEGTRHNVGFMTLDALADKYNIDVREKAFKGLIGKGMIEGNKVILVKPQTYMNLSGECIRQVMDYYKVDPSEFIVIYDDISLVPGRHPDPQKRQRGRPQWNQKYHCPSGNAGISTRADRCGREAGAHGSGRLCAGTFSERGSRNDDDGV